MTRIARVRRKIAGTHLTDRTVVITAEENGFIGNDELDVRRVRKCPKAKAAVDECMTRTRW